MTAEKTVSSEDLIAFRPVQPEEEMVLGGTIIGTQSETKKIVFVGIIISSKIQAELFIEVKA